MNAALYATIWAALVLFVIGEWGKQTIERAPHAARWAWRASLLGALLCIVHIALAMGLRHGWSHDAAVRDTARQTMDVFGTAFGAGVYVNYVFVMVWLAELGWWRADPVGYARRRPLVVWLLRGFYFVILVSAAVIFVRPQFRLAGVALLGFWVLGAGFKGGIGSGFKGRGSR
ncbi:MAG TPA: hypothetical protein VHJ77_17770 [Vicinamibacterales bacterium]|jgi:hypothetical protein|nr:hypothetical protein [Vicinamibacterales bacterium]